MEAKRGKNDLAAAAAAEDMGDGMMTCTDHPYRSNLGGICAFCLQEKLGKLVSSSFPFPILNSPSSGSSPVSFTSDVGSSAHASRSTFPRSGANLHHSSRPLDPAESDSSARRARIPFLLARRRKNKKLPAGPSSRCPTEAVLKRSKSSAGPRRRHFPDAVGDNEDGYDYNPRTRRGGGGGGGGGGFWSFLHLPSSSSSSSKSAASRRGEKPSSGESKMETLTAFEESPDQFPAYERKVSRSRSVGCGSRSFSGDFFERISTGFGDCTLRRVESHREGHKQVQSQQQQQAQKIYRCGGIFGGFMMIGALSASSSYRVSSTIGEDHHHRQVPGKSPALPNTSHTRARSWSWALASPMRAFAKPSRAGRRETSITRNASEKNSAAPNLSAIPSLLTVGG